MEELIQKITATQDANHTSLRLVTELQQETEEMLSGARRIM